MRQSIHLITLVLAWASGTALVCGMIREATGRGLIFEGYSGFFAFWAVVFATICYRTRGAQRGSRPAAQQDGPDESSGPM